MQLTSRLASHMSDLTVQVIKEDWSLPSGPAMATPPSTHIAGHLPSPNLPGVPLPNIYSYEPHPAKFSTESSSGHHNVGGLTTPLGGGSTGGGQVGHYSLNPRLQQNSHFTQL